jgi:hypothetical protein
MITKEELKKEIDRMPENLLERVYFLLKQVILQRRTNLNSNSIWEKWKNSLDKFTPDFMDNRKQPPHQIRESF